MIKNILFDFGDIFIDLDKMATFNELVRLGISEFTEEMMLFNQQYEKGLLSSEEFIDFYARQFPQATKEQLIDAWNAIILSFPERRLAWLEHHALHGQLRFFLLSNTNALHITKVKERMTLARYERFRSCFERFYLSHEIGMRKPDVEIFDLVLEKNDLIAEETLFIDDTKEHIDAADKLGIKTWNLIPGQEDVTELFIRKRDLF
ncbi:HAD family hydrolase [Sungkyunkwania multivorans]|uniref:HAD family hydrolase n=1 Tax=Sungkyunkwania multivorans TaxID=1173618 RepID=A0ABW3CVP5_9FLAO